MNAWEMVRIPQMSYGLLFRIRAQASVEGKLTMMKGIQCLAPNRRPAAADIG